MRNHSSRPLRAGDRSVVRVILSENDEFPDTGANYLPPQSDPQRDFILREFVIDGGNGLGAGLLPNENISFDWIQQLPDNFEGDYYLLVHIEGFDPFPMENTPTITIRSKNKTKLASVDQGNLPTERPSTSSDGRFVAYEKLDANGIQQIWYRDMLLSDMREVQITNNFADTTQGGNGHSLRPQISADGLVIAFHSFNLYLVIVANFISSHNYIRHSCKQSYWFSKQIAYVFYKISL